MKQKSSLFRENIKRFWPACFIAFIVYFISGPFEIIVSGDNLSSYSLESYIGTLNFGYILLDHAMPIAISCFVFGYLQRINSAGVMHSLPYTRKSLYISSYLSGLFLVILPLMLNWLILLMLKRPVLSDGYVDEALTQRPDVYTYSAIAAGFIMNLTVQLFIYSLSCFAAIITGNTVLHLLTACGLNYLVPVIVLSLTAYADRFLCGYCASGLAEDLMIKTAPVLSIIFFGSEPSPALYTGYFAAAAAVSVLSGFIYEKRAIERTGDSYVFNAVGYIIGFLLVFFPATLMAVLFENIYGGFLTGLITGALLGYLIGRCIITKSFRIFNIKNLKLFLVYIFIIALIIAFFAFDIFGYGSRVPDVENVEELSISGSMIREIRFESSENIKTAEALQKEIASAASSASEAEEDCYDYTFFDFRYRLKNGSYFERQYVIPNEQDIKEASREKIKTLFESEEVDKSYDRFSLFSGDNCTVSVEDITVETAAENIIKYVESAADRYELINCIHSDFVNESLEDYQSDAEYAAAVHIERKLTLYEYSQINEEELGNFYINSNYDGNYELVSYTLSADIYVNDTMKNTVAWLDSRGLY